MCQGIKVLKSLADPWKKKWVGYIVREMEDMESTKQVRSGCHAAKDVAKNQFPDIEFDPLSL